MPSLDSNDSVCFAAILSLAGYVGNWPVSPGNLKGILNIKDPFNVRFEDD